MDGVRPMTTRQTLEERPAGTLRDLMRRVAQPVVVVTGRDADCMPWGMTVSSFTSVSLDPPLALFCPASTSTTWAAIGPVGHFMVNVLAAEQQAVAALFAHPSSGFPTRLSHRIDSDGLPVLTGCAATAYCVVVAVYDGGDHNIVLARIGEVSARSTGRPLTYWHGGYMSVRELGEPTCPR